MPRGGGKCCRQRATETWIGRAIEYQHRGVDLLLTGQSPLGEWLAAPSSAALTGLAVCLVDAADEVRLERLRARGPHAPELERAVLNWAEWHRRHARDPQHRQDVLREGGWADMRWERWADWAEGDPRWSVTVVQNGRRPTSSSAADVLQWIWCYYKGGASPRSR